MEVNVKIQKIKAQYEESTKNESEFDKLKKLDKHVKKPVRIFSYALGTAGALVLGTGMTMAMALIPGGMAAGIVVGSAGIAMSGANYPLHKKLISKRKAKHYKEILELSQNALNERSTTTNA